MKLDTIIYPSMKLSMKPDEFWDSQNNSKKLDSLKALASQVQQNFLGVVRILDSVVQTIEPANRSATELTTHQIQDTITQIRNALL
jgi:hypothetical protein